MLLLYIEEVEMTTHDDVGSTIPGGSPDATPAAAPNVDEPAFQPPFPTESTVPTPPPAAPSRSPWAPPVVAGDAEAAAGAADPADAADAADAAGDRGWEPAPRPAWSDETRPFGGATPPAADPAFAAGTAANEPAEPVEPVRRPEPLAQPRRTYDPVPPERPAAATSGGWGKPALAGGLVGALIAGLLTGGAVFLTRDTSDKTVAAAPISATTTVDKGTVRTATPAAGFTHTGTVHAVLEKVEPAVVSIATKGFDPSSFFQAVPSQGAGTGVVISADGYILTNNHVIENATSIKVTFADRKVRDATLVGSDPSADVAVLKVSATGLPTATLGKSGDLQVGDDVVAIGNALALPGGPTVTTGIVSALDRSIADSNEQLSGLIQTDAAINPGNSGGPLVNSNGEVVGINTAIIQDSNNIGFAIAIDKVKPIIDDIRSGKSAVKAQTFLGVSTQTMTSDLRDRYGLPTDKGVLVIEVVSGSPAENAGLRPGDVITKLDGKAVTTSDGLVAEIRKHAPGDKVELTWQRGTGESKATVALGSRGVQSS